MVARRPIYYPAGLQNPVSFGGFVCGLIRIHGSINDKACRRPMLAIDCVPQVCANSEIGSNSGLAQLDIDTNRFAF
jgi:hypothetical protein